MPAEPWAVHPVGSADAREGAVRLHRECADRWYGGVERVSGVRGAGGGDDGRSARERAPELCFVSSYGGRAACYSKNNLADKFASIRL